jgi:hypothetical protein
MARFLNYFKRLMIVVTVLLNTALAAAVLAQYIFLDFGLLSELSTACFH